jgi:hypothetical protein
VGRGKRAREGRRGRERSVEGVGDKVKTKQGDLGGTIDRGIYC